MDVRCTQNYELLPRTCNGSEREVRYSDRNTREGHSIFAYVFDHGTPKLGLEYADLRGHSDTERHLPFFELVSSRVQKSTTKFRQIRFSIKCKRIK